MQHLYVFAGFPGKASPPGACVLHAGGLRLACQLEDIGELEESQNIQVRKEGVFVLGDPGEELLREEVDDEDEREGGDRS